METQVVNRADEPGPSGAPATEAEAMTLSAAAQEAMGFTDDQFMDLSTSGASIHDLLLLSDPSSSSKSEWSRTSGSSLRRFLVTASTAKSRDELSLSASGMSLASLGALSRSAKRQSSGLYNVDEALDDSIVWREQGLKFAEVVEAETFFCSRELARSSSVQGDNTCRPILREGAGATGSPIAAGATTAAETNDRGSGIHDGKHEGHESIRSQGSTSTAIAPAVATAGLQDKRACDSVSDRLPTAAPSESSLGKIQDLSLRVAELRQQSYHKRRLTAPMRGRSYNGPPPLPKGVDLAPPEEISDADVLHGTEPLPREASPSDDSFLNPVPGHRARTPASSWNSTRSTPASSGAAGAARVPRSDSLDGSGSRGGHSSGSNSSRVRRKGSGRASAALAFMKNMGISRHAAGTSGDAAASADGDGGSSTNSWSADSSGQGLHASNCPANNADSPADPLSQASCVPRGSTSTTATGRDQAAAIAKRRGLRGRLGQVWGGRKRLAAHRQKEDGTNGHGHEEQQQQQQQQHEEGDAEEACEQEQQQQQQREQEQSQAVVESGGMMQLPAVLQPSGDGAGGFAFLPALGPRLSLSPAPDTFPEWMRAKSAPAGPVESANNAGMAGPREDPSALFPLTPLERSNRSFDLVRSPQAYDADASNASLSNALDVSRTAAESVASFDPNRSTRSWFDMSGSHPNNVDAHLDPSDIWKLQLPSQHHIPHQQHQQQERQDLQRDVRLPLRRRQFPRTGPAAEQHRQREQEETAAAAARALDEATAAADAAAESAAAAATVSTVATFSNSAADPVRCASADASSSSLAPVLLDEDQLVVELSDLSVSSGRRRRGRGRTAITSPSVAIDDIDTMGMMRTPEDAQLVPDPAMQAALAAVGSEPLDHVESMEGDGDSWQGVRVPHGWSEAEQAALHDDEDSFIGGVRDLASAIAPDSEGAQQRQQHQQHQQHQQASVWDETRATSGAAGSGTAVPDEGMPQSSASREADNRQRDAPLGVPTSSDWVDLGVPLSAIGIAAGGDMAPTMNARIAEKHLAPQLSRKLAPSDRDTRPRSVDTGRLQQIARDLDGQTLPYDDDACQVWKGAWNIDSERSKSIVVDPSATPPPLDMLSAPLPLPQRSVSLDHSLSESRSSRRGGCGGSGGQFSCGNDSPNAQMRGDTTWNKTERAESGAAAPPTLDGDDSVPPLPLRGDVLPRPPEEQQQQQHRESWSALHAMIPMPGSSAGQMRRATYAGPSLRPDQITTRRASDMGKCPAGAKEQAGASSNGSFGRSLRTPPTSAPMNVLAANSPEVVSKRRLNPSRLLDVFGKHKKQCLDGPVPPSPAGPTGEPASNSGPFEPLEFLRGRFGTTPSTSSASSATPSAASASSKKSTSFSASSFSGQIEGANAPDATPGETKNSRQVVAARRPRNRGRFMKSQQKWVTQGELKQTKVSGGEGGATHSQATGGQELSRSVTS